jgi:hypothetical protein
MVQELLDRTVLGERLGTVGEEPLTAGRRQWLSALAALHDVGGLSGVGVERTFAGMVNVLTGRSREERLRKLLCRWLGEDVDHAVALARAVTAFGGLAQRDDSRARLPASFESHLEELDALLQKRFPRARSWSGLRQYTAWRLYAGLVALASQLGDGAYHGAEQADALSDCAVRRLGMLGIDRRSVNWPAAPSGINLPEGSAVRIFEGRVGSGKTKKVIEYGLALIAAGRVDNIILACRTRASVLHTHEYLRKLLGSLDAPIVRGLPWDVEPEGTWWTERTWRYMLAPVTVTTQEQVFNSIRIEKHAYLRSTTLARALVVLDDVHTSEPRDRALSTAIIQHQVGLCGGYVAVTSAVLDATARSEMLLERFPSAPSEEEFDRHQAATTEADQSSAIEEPYPCQWTGERAAAQVGVQAGRSSPRDFVPVADFLPNDDTVAKAAIEHASRGARVLVIRNTMIDTIGTAREVDRRDGEHMVRVGGKPITFHSHYTAEDRHVINHATVVAIGEESSQHGKVKPAIVVGTSQIDSGLHLDADVLVTDVAPVDVMVRRLGRLHAIAKAPRPKGYDKPLLLVVAPPVQVFVQAVGVRGEAHRIGMGLGSVYRDMAVLHRTWENLKARGGIDRGRPRLDIEEARHPYHLKWLMEAGTRWVDHERWLRAREQRITTVVESLRWSAAGGAFGMRDCDVQATSTLGEPSEAYIEDHVMRVFFDGIASPLGTTMQRLDVRACGSVKPNERVEPTQTDEGWVFGGGHVYDNFGYRWVGEAEE